MLVKIVIAVLLALAFLSSPIKADPTDAAPSQNIVQLPTPDAASQPLTLDTSNIIFGAVKSFRVVENGSVDISNAVEATDTRTRTKINQIAFSAPSVGSIYASAGSTYFEAPFSSGTLNLQARAITIDGYYKIFVFQLHIDKPKVLKSKAYKPADSTASPASVDDSCPQVKAAVPDGYMCEVTGCWPGHAGSIVHLIVQNELNVNYAQSDAPIVDSNGLFHASVYLGDAEGHGIGERFILWAIDSHGGNLSNTVAVRRIN